MSTRSISSGLKELDSSFATKVFEKHLSLRPEIQKKYGEREKRLYIQDTLYHIRYLAESINAEEPVLFSEYFGWAKTFFAHLNVPEQEFLFSAELLSSALKEVLPEEMSSVTSAYITRASQYFKEFSGVPPSFFTEDSPHSILAGNYLQALVSGEKREAQRLILEAFENGVSIKDLYLNVFQPAQKETGRLWQMSKISVAQEHYITAATQLMMALLYPNLFSASVKKHKIIVSCIEGELHEIGARMVADLFELEGWNSYYFGANIPKRSLIKAVRDYSPDIVAISATMTFHISEVEEMIRLIREADPGKNIKILVGGYPFIVASQLWQKVGADGCATDALGAIRLAEQLVRGKAADNVH